MDIYCTRAQTDRDNTCRGLMINTSNSDLCCFLYKTKNKKPCAQWNIKPMLYNYCQLQAKVIYKTDNGRGHFVNAVIPGWQKKLTAIIDHLMALIIKNLV